MICSVAVLAATNSEPYVAVSTVACFLEYQSVGVWLQKWRHGVRDALVARQWRRLASSVVVVVTDLQRGVGQLLIRLNEHEQTCNRHITCLGFCRVENLNPNAVRTLGCLFWMVDHVEG